MRNVELSDDSMCFACGELNEDGLHLEFLHKEDEIRTVVSFPKKYQGYADVVHGGLISTVLDETMVTLLNKMGHLAVTAELSVRFLSPLRIGEKMEVKARLADARGRVFRVTSDASTLKDGKKIATAEARCISMGPLPEGVARERGASGK